MKIPQLKFFVLLFSLEILYSLSINIPELGYNEFELKPGITELVYTIKKTFLEDVNNSSFISFVVFEDNLNLTFYMKEFEDSKSEPIIIPKKQWLSLPLMIFQLTQMEIHLVFVINNDNSFPAKLIFIDNSKELNINLEKFLNWKYKILYENNEDYAPTPLIFSIDEVKEDTTIELELNDEDKIYNDSNVMYYCINKGSDCQYNAFTKLTLIKDQKYKFKLNSFIDENKNYYFYIPYKLDNTSYPLDINQINFGITNFDIDENTKEKYFIAYIKGLENFYIRLEYNQFSNFGYQIINKSQKENIDKEINNIQFYYQNFSDYIPIWNLNDDDYLIVKINYLESYNKGSIILLNEFNIFGEYKKYNLDKGVHSIFLFIGNLDGENKYYINSTRKNMALLYDFNPPLSIEYTDKFIFEGSGENKLIYVNSKEGNTIIEYSLYEIKDIIEFNLEEKVQFDFENRNKFKLNYKHEGDYPLNVYFIFENIKEFILNINYEGNNQTFIINKTNNPLNMTLSKTGIYYFYFELTNDDEFDSVYKYFTTYIPNKVIYSTDLSQKYYIYKRELFSPKDIGPQIIKIQNLKEDKCIYMNYKVLDDFYSNYIKSEDLKNRFEITNDNTNEEFNDKMILFCFSKNYNYTVKIHFSETKSINLYYFPTFEFYTISQSSIKGKQTNLYSFSDNQLFIFNLEKDEELFLTTLNSKETYIGYSEENISLDNVSSLQLEKVDSQIETIRDHKSVLIMIIAQNNTYETKAILANKLLQKNDVHKFNIPKDENAIIYLNEQEKDDNIWSTLKLRKMTEEEVETEVEEQWKEEEVKEAEEQWKEEEVKEAEEQWKEEEEKEAEEQWKEEEQKEEDSKEEEQKEEDSKEEEWKEGYDEDEREEGKEAYDKDEEEEKGEDKTPEEESHNDDDDYSNSHPTLTTFSSQEKNMEYFTLSSPGEKTNIICQSNYPMIIYVDKVKKDNVISIKTYEGKYAFFLAFTNNDLLKAYIDMIKRNNEEDEENIFNLKFPLNIRLNSDINTFYDFINLYFSDIKEKIIVYIKKFYGGTDLYECDFDIKEESDYSLITKPLPPCKNKKSIFNRIIKLEDIKLLSGYLGPNSYFDIYLDIKEFPENKVINPIFNSIGYEEIGFSYGAKYLEKDIEYTLNVTGRHIIKLEPGFEAEVEISDGLKKVILNPNKLTGEIEGQKIKIKSSNNNAMIYFYGKLYEEFNQIKIEPGNVGKNYKITFTNGGGYILDFGFKGYYFANLFDSIFINGDDENQKRTIYLENIYDKLTEKLVDGENLYLYYSKYDEAKIEYTSVNINPSNNEFTFNVIPKNNEEEKTLIINSLNINKIRYQVYNCYSPDNQIKMYYQSSQDSSESEMDIIGDIILEDNIKAGTTKFRFKSNEDFIFAYSFIDNFDKEVREKWINERNETLNLTINKINKKENSNLYTINFNANYRNSSTRYIIVISPKNEEYTKETLSNPCFITKLVTEKSEQVKIINIANVGETEYIDVDVDLYSVPENKGEYVIGIISQEIRFEKKINFYEPFEYIENELKPKEVDIKGKGQEFDLSKNENYFSVFVENKPEHNNMLLLHYKVEQSSSFIIQLYGPRGNGESFEIKDDEGFINFLYDRKGTYKILFTKEENKLLRSLSSSDTSIRGTFQIFTTETPFDLDLEKDNIEFKEFNIDNAKDPSLKFNIKPDKDYIKKISIANYDFSNINEMVSINENNLGDKSLNFTYYTFEKNSEYLVTIKFKHKGGDSYTLEKVNILGYSSIEQNKISSGLITYNDNKDRFLTIDWKGLKKVNITIKSKEPVISISEITERQSKNLVKEFKNLKFTELKNLTLTKPEKSSYSLLMIEPEDGTQINVELTKAEEDDDDDDGNGWVIVLIIILAIIVFIVLLILIFGYIRRKNQDIDFKKKAEDIQQETLLKDF